MAVSDNNKRISVKLSKEQYSQLEKLASKESRSVSNYIGYLVKKHLEKKLGE